MPAGENNDESAITGHTPLLRDTIYLNAIPQQFFWGPFGSGANFIDFLEYSASFIAEASPMDPLFRRELGAIARVMRREEDRHTPEFLQEAWDWFESTVLGMRKKGKIQYTRFGCHADVAEQWRTQWPAVRVILAYGAKKQGKLKRAVTEKALQGADKSSSDKKVSTAGDACDEAQCHASRRRRLVCGVQRRLGPESRILQFAHCGDDEAPAQNVRTRCEVCEGS